MAGIMISVVISTYNRADRLPLALEALERQAGHVPHEVIVVDNNSTDDTATVVTRAATRPGSRIRYVFEGRQGLSYGRNAGIAAAHGDIIALTDDDVRVAEDWLVQVEQGFRNHPDVDYIGGRVRPHWLAPAPAWLTTAHWAPLALQDYGDEPMTTGRPRAICLVGANLGFRRRVFDTVGLFTPSLGRIKDGIGSTEDHDMQLRIWRMGGQGLYLPSIVCVADVTSDRLLKAYHRRWHHGHGRHCAMMRLREFVPADMGPLNEPKDLVTLFGSPGFVYADVLRNGWRWLNALVRRQDPLFYEHQFRHVCSYLQTRRQIVRAQGGRGTAAEVLSFGKAYLRKRLSRREPRPASA
jgi:glycosyltransferase involved in cell wall biosynthesis